MSRISNSAASASVNYREKQEDAKQVDHELYVVGDEVALAFVVRLELLLERLQPVCTPARVSGQSNLDALGMVSLRYLVTADSEHCSGG
jgi:hypothetical protein